MPKIFMFLIIGLFFGAGFGFLFGATSGVKPTSHDHGAHDHGDASLDAGHMGHDTLIEAGTPAPTLMLHVLPDGAQSRNFHLMTTIFTFAPQHVNTDHIPGEGHAHVNIDGVKQPRVYSPYVHLDALPKGTHDIRVTLNANDHGQLAIWDTPIIAVTQITIQ